VSDRCNVWPVECELSYTPCHNSVARCNTIRPIGRYSRKSEPWWAICGPVVEKHSLPQSREQPCLRIDKCMTYCLVWTKHCGSTIWRWTMFQSLLSLLRPRRCIAMAVIYGLFRLWCSYRNIFSTHGFYLTCYWPRWSSIDILWSSLSINDLTSIFSLVWWVSVPSLMCLFMLVQHKTGVPNLGCMYP